MAAIVTAVASGVVKTSEPGESLSGIFGCISLVAWICLLVSSHLRLMLTLAFGTDGLPKLPQLVTNYKAQSADGLSMGFLFIWLLGDITNLAGTQNIPYHPPSRYRRRLP